MNNRTHFRPCDRFKGFLATVAGEDASVQMLHCPGQGVRGRRVR